MGGKMQNRRQRFSLASAFRLRLTRYIVFLLVFALVALGLCVLFFFLWSPIPRQLLFVTDPHAQSTARVFSNTVRSIFIFFFVLNLLFLWLTSVIAKRVIGPFVRINRVLEQLAAGDIPKEVRFRKNDETPFQQLTDPLNRVLAYLSSRREELRSIKKEIESSLTRGEAGGLSKEALESLTSVNVRLEKLI